MAVSTSTPADVANLALTRLGYRLKVGSLLDGSDHANTILQVYGQARDDTLRSYDYAFAQRSVSLTLLKESPAGGYFPPNAWDPATMPPIGFMKEYGFPDDCIKVRIVKRRPGFVFDPAPIPTDWTEANDNSFTPPRRVILCNFPDAIAVYTARVTDPTTWDIAFTEALAATLAERAGAALVGIEAQKAQAANAQTQFAMSTMEDR
jgi:hypothetical protein